MKGKRRTFVLVHGAWHGGWCWRRVAAQLTSAGHAVFTPTQTGLGERRHLLDSRVGLATFVEDIANVIEAEELSGIDLVGHSFGGRIVCALADRMPDRIRRLVLLDASIPESGRPAFDDLPPPLREARLRAAHATSGGLSIPPPEVASFGLREPDDLAWVQRRLTPHPTRAYAEAIVLANPPGNGLPVTYIRCINPAYQAVEASAAKARQRVDWQYLELDAGHDAMVSAPGALGNLLLELP